MAASETVQAQATPPAAAPAFAGKHEPKPLKFNPAKLTGLSEKLIRSHWENNYIGSIKTLNAIETRLAAAMADADLPPVVYGGLSVKDATHRLGRHIMSPFMSSRSRFLLTPAHNRNHR